MLRIGRRLRPDAGGCRRAAGAGKTLRLALRGDDLFCCVRALGAASSSRAPECSSPRNAGPNLTRNYAHTGRWHNRRSERHCPLMRFRYRATASTTALAQWSRTEMELVYQEKRMADQTRKAEQFRALHIPGKPLVLFNIWDAGGAKAVAGGAKAIATGSWAVANANGFADGERIPLALAIDNLRRIVGRSRPTG